MATRVGLAKIWMTPFDRPTPKTFSLVQSSCTYLECELSYCDFCVEISKFSLPGFGRLRLENLVCANLRLENLGSKRLTLEYLMSAKLRLENLWSARQWQKNLGSIQVWFCLQNLDSKAEEKTDGESVQDEVNQWWNKHNDLVGTKKGADSTGVRWYTSK